MDIQQYSSRRDAETDTGTDWFVGLGGFTVSLLIAGVLEGPRATIGSTNVALFLAAYVGVLVFVFAPKDLLSVQSPTALLETD